MSDDDSIEQAATSILHAFVSYLRQFTAVTRRALKRFERRDWVGGRADSAERLTLYEDVVSNVAPSVRQLFPSNGDVTTSWTQVRHAYAERIHNRCDRDLAETFFNSVTRSLLAFKGLRRELEFFSFEPAPEAGDFCSDLFQRYERQVDSRVLIRNILHRHRFSVPYEDLDRDVASIVNEVNLFLWPLTRGETTFDAEILNEVFFRNKAAYIVGRLLAGARVIPLILPLYNDDGGIHVDAVLLTGGDVGSIFGFAYSPFHVVSAAPNDLVRFLRSILSRKPLSEIYNSIGFPKHGKTEFYADLHRYVHTTRERFVIAPGLEGAVMTVFTLPNHPYVFKVIKDRPCFLRSGQVTTKSITNAQVREKYRFVSGRDRVGRLVDTQEFEFLRFRRWRYSDPVLDELQQAARNAITFDGEHVIVHHCYIQRRVIPLPMYLEVERNPERIRRIVLDFGYFIKDLAGTGLFASDLFNKWNYGVTDRSRVVLYDYDDIMPLEHMRFRVKPLPRDDDEAWLAEEDRIAADEYDFFMDEIERWLGIPQQLRGIFDAVHADLYTPVFWDLCRKRLLRGEVADIYPYDRSKRFLLPPAFPSAGQPLH